MRRITRRLLLGFAAWLMTAGGGSAQQKDGERGDLVEEAKRRAEVAVQALEREVKTALEEADKLRADPAKAVELLQPTLKKLEADAYLSITRRAALLADVRERLKVLEKAAAAPAKTTGEAPKSAGKDLQEQQLRQGIDAVRALRQQGRLAEAQKAADDLARRFPDSPAAQLVRRNTATAQELSETTKVAEQKAGGALAALTGVDKSARPISGDIEYPKNFAEMSQKRLEKYGKGMVKLTDKEKAILKVLNEVTAARLDLKNESLEKIIDYLRKELGQPISVNKTAIDELNLTYDMPVTVSLPKGITKRTLLRSILNDLGLAYIIKNEQIEITSVPRAQNELSVRYYLISDLLGLGGVNGLGTGVTLGGNNPAGVAKQVEFLIELIQTTIDPASWEKNGGPGTITYHAQTRMLIIKNTAEVHNMMGTSMSR